MFKTPPRHSIHIHPDLIKVIGGDRKNTLGGGRSTSSRQKPPGKTGASKTKVSERAREGDGASERSSFIRPSRTILQISKGRSFVHSFVRSLRAVATFRDKIANNIGASPSVL